MNAGVFPRAAPRRLISSVAVLVALFVFGTPASSVEASPCAAVRAAAGVNRAGLVVEFGDGSIQRFCISFTETSITGFDLLERSRLSIVYQDYGGGSVLICKIGPDGCNYPQQSCVCKCQNVNVNCRFWGYYVRDRSTGAWRLSNQGAGERKVVDGDVDGWRWGMHQPSNPPPATTLAAVCASGTQIGPTAAPSSRSTHEASPTPGASSAPSNRQTAGTVVPASSTPTNAGARSSPDEATSPGVQAQAGPGTGRTNRGAPNTVALAAVGLAAAGLAGWGWLRLRSARRAE